MINDECLEKLMKTIEVSNKKTIEYANKKQTDDIRGYIKQEIDELSRKFEEKLKKTNEEYETKYNDLKLKYDKLEKELRKNNVIIFGLQNQDENLANCVINTLNNHLQLSLTINDIDNAYKIGKNPQNKAIIVKFSTYLCKQQVLKNCKKLKGTAISIGEQLSHDEQNDNKILREHMKIARANHHKAVIVKNKLIINGQKYTAQELETMKNGNQGTQISSVSEEREKNMQQLSLIVSKEPEKYINEKRLENQEIAHFSEIVSDSKKKKTNNEPLKVRSTRLRINSNM